VIDLRNGPPWLPGQSRDLEIVFLTLDALDIKLEPGKVWRIQEGAQLVGIVALARKLLVALWRYTTAGVVIEGAVMRAA